MQTVFLIFMFIVGACIGSFLCCEARRLRERESSSKSHSRSQKSTHPISGKSLGSRSICLSCRTKLKWHDNLPILSWLFLRGKCRKCHHRIGFAEILSEIIGALAFLGLANTIQIASAAPLDWAVFGSTLILTAILGFLAIYDGLYGELPTIYLTISIICAIITVVLKEWAILSNSSFTAELIIDPLLSTAILGGIYLLLYLISKGRWVGDGDWLLGTAIGLALMNPWLSLIALFLTNFLACLIMYPVTRGNPKTKIHLGPFMVAAFIIVMIFAEPLTKLML